MGDSVAICKSGDSSLYPLIRQASGADIPGTELFSWAFDRLMIGKNMSQYKLFEDIIFLNYKKIDIQEPL